MGENTKLLIGGLRYLEGQWITEPRTTIAMRLARMRAEVGPTYRKSLVRFGDITGKLRRN